MTEPTASVVITNHNYALFLREAIDSALAQTLNGVEVIVVDDGSTDESRSVIESYGDAIRPVLKDNGGQTSAMNAGVELARGRFVVFLDADDTVSPEALERAAKLFDHGVARVFWRLWEVDERGAHTGRIQPDWGEPAAGDLRKVTLRQGPDAYVVPPQSGNAFSAEVLERACPLPEIEREWGTGSAHADAFLADLAGLLGSARELSEPAGTRRVHSSNDWAKLGPEEKLERSVRLYDERCTRVERYCEQLGFVVDPIEWRRRSWLMRTVRARQELEAVVPAGAALTVLDDDAVSLAAFSTRIASPFPDRDGEYWGSPADDDEAIRALERVRQRRGGFFAVLWPAFWWDETYPRFASHLEATVPCVRSTEDLRVYSFDGERAP